MIHIVNQPKDNQDSKGSIETPVVFDKGKEPEWKVQTLLLPTL